MPSRDLSRAECMSLLSQVPIGRAGVSHQALPAIFPIAFRTWGADWILLGASANSRPAISTNESIVAFQADSYDTSNQTGWTVLGVGPASRVEDVDAFIRHREGLPAPWTVGELADCLMQLKLVNLSGQEECPFDEGNEEDAGD